MAPEMKFGLWPLVFGTLKATVYTMLFGAPLALLAAVYTSEFMQPGVRAVVKPVIEMMASLPSVVLGFLAALVFAPVIERFIPATLSAFFTIPLAFLLVAHLWQLLPQRTLLRLQKYRFVFLLCVLPLGFVPAVILGPPVERLFFAGDVMRWLDGQIGNGVGAWFLLWLPLSAFAILMMNAVTINPWLRSHAQHLNRGQFAVLSLVKFVLLTGATFLLAYGISVSLDSAGWDPRGSYVDTYVQRNALVVGFVMGFAVIPIIYTLADDALRTVPEHLRSASLGCGATPWQTAMRVVVPTAMSGLFSALMIGLGRAVGETMIVLMAGGNTPVTKWNIFEGFRTLSANIAVELPEAVKDSTHFRTLFLAALTLLIMTFFINTLAEIVRLRFRRRAYQL
jgi:phosphate transport system permease protein